MYHTFHLNNTWQQKNEKAVDMETKQYMAVVQGDIQRNDIIIWKTLMVVIFQNLWNFK